MACPSSFLALFLRLVLVLSCHVWLYPFNKFSYNMCTMFYIYRLVCIFVVYIYIYICSYIKLLNCMYIQRIDLYVSGLVCASIMCLWNNKQAVISSNWGRVGGRGTRVYTL